MGHGPVKLLSSVLSDLYPGDIFYPLNSQDPLVAVFIVEGAVITNTGEVFLAHRVIRECGEWEFSFPFYWDKYVDATDFEIELSSFVPDDFEAGMIVLLLSEDKYNAELYVLEAIDMKSQKYITSDGTFLDFNLSSRIIPTGMKYIEDEAKQTNDSSETEGCQDDA